MPRPRRPDRRVEEYTADPMPRDTWPATLAPVAQLLDHGLDLDTVTVFVGENGAGKSTLVEAIALAFGMGPEGGLDQVRPQHPAERVAAVGARRAAP
ncbi:AAA family ATPase [Curtobacterium sp. SL109]|uniref:AAA family ATPase n=1 Tax=Curtobacterium sp. SL109 TaxID=2994662 RepID=UPI002DD4256F|nr:AAA family ATPase [Curtobacterium sp. SL109]